MSDDDGRGERLRSATAELVGLLAKAAYDAPPGSGLPLASLETFLGALYGQGYEAGFEAGYAQGETDLVNRLDSADERRPDREDGDGGLGEA